MNGSVLHYGIEFVSNKIVPQDISTQTSDFVPVLLIVFAVAAALSSAFLIYRKLCVSNANTSLASMFNNKFIKSKSAAIILGIFLIVGALLCLSIKQAHAADLPDNLQRIIVIIDEETGTLTPQNAVFKNDTCYQTKFLKSSVNVLPAGEKFANLDDTDFLLSSENGLVFEGEADEEIYDNSKCLPFNKGEKYNLNLAIDNISFETASKLVGLGPVFQIDIQCEIYCMVCFDEQCHGIAPEPQIVQLYDKVEKPENLQAKYYIFDGWFSEPECANTFDFDDEITNDTIIYAGWTSKFESEFEKQILNNPEYATYVAENKISVNIQTADGKMEYSYNGDKQASSASMIKLLILAEFMDQVDSGIVRLNDFHVINQTDKSTGGAGHINGFALGTRVPYDDIAKFMIMYSDNAASNVLIDLLGKEQINAKAAELGLKCTVLGRKLIVETPPPDNYTCAEDCATILDGIYNKTIASRFMCDKAISYLKQQTDKAAMGQVFKDHNIMFAHKTGNLLGKVNVRHDAGIAYTKNPFIISCIIELPEGQANPIHQKIAEIAINTIN